jgi:hypothetical protein
MSRMCNLILPHMFMHRIALVVTKHLVVHTWVSLSYISSVTWCFFSLICHLIFIITSSIISLIKMDCFQERENCLSCLSLGCFWGSLGTGQPGVCRILGNTEASIISPGNWRLCPTVLPIVKAPVYSEYQLPDFIIIHAESFFIHINMHSYFN